jgi:glycopeptide antibiotics resistance protein
VNTSGVLAQLAALALFVVPVAIALSLGVRTARRAAGEQTREQAAAFLCFCVYVALVGAATLAPPPMSISNGHFGTNLVPLINSFRCFIPNPGQPSTTRFCLETIVGNFALFVPLGALLPLVSREKTSAKTVFAVATTASASIELLQFAGRWVGNPRWSDVDDVIFNVGGAIAGYALLQLLVRYARREVRMPRTSGIFRN